MTTFRKALMGVVLLLPLAACPSDDPSEVSPDGSIDGSTNNDPDAGPLPQPGFTACEGDVDQGKDGTIDGLWVYSYKDGNFLKDELDLGLDGVLDEVVDYVYEGNFLKAYQYRTLDAKTGQLALFYAEEYTNDAEGRILTILADVDGDGVIDRKITNVRDTEGKITEAQIDTGNDGTIDTLRKNTFVDGRLSFTEVDTGNDGTIDSKLVYGYDADGHLIRTETDNGLDGTVDRLDTRTYESHGWIETDLSDRGNDGLVDYEYRRAYADNLPKSFELITRAEGAADKVELQTYRYECGDEKPRARPDRARMTAEIRAAARAARR